jgi:hypothetical protein
VVAPVSPAVYAEPSRMHRKAEEEPANGDDDNVARRRPGLSDAA